MIKKSIKKNKAYPAKRERSGGFVLLFAVTLSAILLSIALGVSNITFRELKFSTNARDTNNAFFAADTGAECAEYYDGAGRDKFLFSLSSSQTFNCAGEIITATKPASPLFCGGGNSSSCWVWDFEIASGDLCATVEIGKQRPNPTDPYAITATTIVSKGYSTCSSSNSNRVEREIYVNY